MTRNDNAQAVSTCNVFHDARASLGEGLLIDRAGQQVFWVDINKGKIFRRYFVGQFYREYSVGGLPSVLLRLDGHVLVFCDNRGLASLDIDNGDVVRLSDNPDTASNEKFRSNDGVELAGGSIIYGTMECSPTGVNGGLYYYDGLTTKSLGIPIGIPNGFIRLSDTDIVIVDSFMKSVDLYSVDCSNSTIRFKRRWHDFSSNRFTPDGGCTDYKGNVYFALWDGSGVAVLDYSGNLVQIIELPVPRPTNCKLAGDNRLLVTTARDGLSGEELREAPLSGSVLEIQLR